VCVRIVDSRAFVTTYQSKIEHTIKTVIGEYFYYGPIKKLGEKSIQPKKGRKS